MIYYMHGMSKPYIMAFDIEYDKEKLIQVAGIILKNIGKNIYQIYRSFNSYIKQENLSIFVQQYTNITQEFIAQYGVSLSESIDTWNKFVEEIDYDDMLIVSHGIYQDSVILKNNGFDITPYEQWCTYNMSKWVLDRDCNISLSDLCQEFGMIPISTHNAYADSLMTLNILSVLLKIEEDT